METVQALVLHDVIRYALAREARAAQSQSTLDEARAQEVDRLRRENERLRQELEERAKEIADQAREIEDLRQLALRQQNSTVTSKPPSSDGLASQPACADGASRVGESRAGNRAILAAFARSCQPSASTQNAWQDASACGGRDAVRNSKRRRISDSWAGGHSPVMPANVSPNTVFNTSRAAGHGNAIDHERAGDEVHSNRASQQKRFADG